MLMYDIPQETVFGIKTAKGDKYSPDEEELDDMDDFGETLTEFIEQYLAGKLEVSKVSEWSGSLEFGYVVSYQNSSVGRRIRLFRRLFQFRI